MSNRVYIFDTTLRDGEQSPGCSMTVPEKLRMARKLVELGVDILEAGFPIASDGDCEAVDAVSREYPWVQVAALARCCTLDVERAASALKRAKRPRIHTFLATSPIHLKYKLKKTQDQVLDEAIAAVELARRHVDDVEFSAEDGARTHEAVTDAEHVEAIMVFLKDARRWFQLMPDIQTQRQVRVGHEPQDVALSIPISSFAATQISVVLTLTRLKNCTPPS